MKARSLIVLPALLLLVPLFTSAATCITLTRTLSLEATGAEVSSLQQFLKDTAGYTGTVSGHYGSLTEAAVKKWQSAHGIAPTGATGPNTRAAMSCTKPAAQTATPVPTQTTSVNSGQTRTLIKGMSGSDVTALQKFLVGQKFLAPQWATSYFGENTEAAVKKFQTARKVAAAGVVGYGMVGPRTRAAIASLSTGDKLRTQAKEIVKKAQALKAAGKLTPEIETKLNQYATAYVVAQRTSTITELETQIQTLVTRAKVLKAQRKLSAEVDKKISLLVRADKAMLAATSTDDFVRKSELVKMILSQ